MYKAAIFILLSFFAFSGHASCIDTGSAYAYGCIELDESKAHSECRGMYGEKYLAYEEVGSCTEEWAAYFRGEVELPKEETIEISEETVTCLTYTKGSEFNCEIIENVQADNFCASKFGYKYLPYKQSNSCTVEMADEFYGYVSNDEIVGDLKAMVAQAEAIMFMVDREDMRESLGGLISFKPIMGNDFYSPIMKGLLSKLKVIQTEIKKRSQLKFKFNTKEAAELVDYSFRYVNLTNRVHKVYAHVAHKNHEELKSYSFDNLDFLNLVVSKAIGLEIMSKFSLKAKNLENDMVLFTQLEQSKQVYEYLALAEPSSKVDYTKLVSFMGLRENLTNFWALDKLSERTLLKKSYHNYGNFLSFRKNRFGYLSELPTIKENQEFEVFYADYWNRVGDLIKITNSINLLDSENTLNIFKELLGENKEIQEFLSESIHNSSLENIDTFKIAESQDWKMFSEFHFRSIILPGDGVLNKQNLIGIIADKVYERRLEAIINAFEGRYAFLEEDTLNELTKKLVNKINNNIKYSFLGDLRMNMFSAFENYNNRDEYAKVNYEEKVKNSVKSLKKIAKIANQYLLFETKLRVNPNIQPKTYEELVFLFENKISYKYMDIKKALDEDKSLAGVLGEFFNKIAEKFNSKYLVQQADMSYELQGTDDERSEALINALYDTAREYYIENKFEVTELAMVPNAALMARSEDREELTNNPYMIQIYRDGTPVTVHINTFYKSFQKQMEFVLLDRVNTNTIVSLMGLKYIDEYETRNISDQVTDGTFDRPESYIFSDGEISYDNVNGSINTDSLKRLYLNSLDYTKEEIKHNYADQKRAKIAEASAKAEQYNNVPGIKNSKKIFARVFELFNIPMGSIANNIPVTKFSLTKADQKVLAENAMTKIYVDNPILRLEIKTEEKKEEWITPRSDFQAPYIMDTSVTKDRSVLLKTAYHAYDLASDTFDEVKATEFVEKVINRAKRNVKSNLSAFMNIKYLKIKENPQLRRAFKAASYLRNTLKSPSGTTIYNAKNIEKFDELIMTDIRTKSEALNEDYLEPVMIWMGVAAITAFGIIALVGSMGLAAPAILSAFIAFEFVTGGILMVASTTVRINSGFYDMPAQMKFQKSLAHSQITKSKIVDYDMIKEEEKAMHFSQMLEIGLMPLNLLYGKMIISQARKNLGSHAKVAFEKLSNTKMRSYSAPSTPMTRNASFSKLRKEFGTLKGAYKSAKYAVTRAKAYLPKYHTLPDELVGTNLLRVGLFNGLKRIGLHQNPWKIVDEIRTHSGKLKEKISKYHQFVSDEAAVVAQIESRKIVEHTKVVALEAHHNSFNYTMRSFGRSIKQFKTLEYIRNFKNIRKEMQYLNEQLLKNKVLKLEKMIEKIDSLKAMRSGQSVTNKDSRYIQEVLSELSDEEIMIFREVIEKSGVLHPIKKIFDRSGLLHPLKKVYAQYDEVTGGGNFIPTTYLYGHINEKFRAPVYKTNAFLGQAGSSPVLKSDAEDIVNFYESLIQQNGFRNEATDVLRKNIEEMIQTLFVIDKNGVRMYPQNN
jgi:hypothetical protein